MSIECSNTTPISGQTSVLTTPVGAIDFSVMLTTDDPLDSVNRVQVIEITDKLNGLLPTIGLSQFPTLDARFRQFPLTYTEIADYIITNNINTVNVLSAINSYDGKLGNAVITSTLGDLDFHYNVNLGKSISEGVCGKFGNALAELLALFSMIDGAIDKLSGLKLDDFDLKKLSISKIQMLTLEEIKDKLLETIDELVEKIQKKVQDAVDKAIEDITTIIGNAGDKILTQLTKMRDEITDFFSDENIEQIRKNFDKFIGEMIAVFERPTLANVQLIMFKLCNLTETLMSILFGPADEIAEVAKVVEQEKKVLDAMEAKNALDARNAGATRVDKEVAEEVKEEVTNNMNRLTDDNNPNRYVVKEAKQTRRGTKYDDIVKYRQPGELGYVDPSTGTLSIPTNVDYVTSDSITAEETKSINAMSETGLGPGALISWSDTVIKGEQWQDIDNGVLARLLRISALTGEKYVLKQGVVKPNTRSSSRTAQRVRKQGSSMYHHKYSGFAVQLFVSESNRDKTIIAASRAGFSGIGVAKDYLALHVGNRDGEVANQDDARWPTEQTFAPGTELIKYQSMMRKHREDGYRRKMEPDESFRFYDKSTFKEEKQNDDTFSFTDNNSILGVPLEETQPAPFSLLRPTD